jgi:hypothetical protein
MKVKYSITIFLFLFLFSSISLADSVTCERAIAFYPLSSHGVVDKSKSPIVIRLSVVGQNAYSAQATIRSRAKLAIDTWKNRTNKNVFPTPIIKNLNQKFEDDVMICWEGQQPTNKKTVIDSWPKANWPANPIASLPFQVVSPKPIVPVDYIADDQNRYAWRAVPNIGNYSFWSCDGTFYYEEMSSDGLTKIPRSKSGKQQHIVGPEENAKSAMRKFLLDEIKKDMNGLRWYPLEPSIQCIRE